MDDLLYRLLFYEDLSPEEQHAAREALSDTLEENAALERPLRQWQAARQHVGERFRRDLPARPLLVLYALAEDPQTAETLSKAEQRDLEAARPQIEQALRRHPALDDVIRQIRRERTDFEAAWHEHTDTSAPPPRSEKAARDRTASRPASGRSPKRRPVRSGSTSFEAQRWGFRAAAAVALVAFAVVLFFVFQRDQHTITVTAEGDTPRVVQLADGSEVRLLPGATLAYVEAEAALDRQATLKSGRAFFDIAPAQQGFLLETPTARLTVLGTRFGVTAEEDLTHVVLAFGRVSLASKAAARRPVTLQPGQQSRVAQGALPATPVPVEDLSEALAWTGLFVFRSTPAADIARHLNMHYGQTVEVAPPLQDEEVTGTFDRSRPLRETLRTLAAALNARVEPLPGGFVLVPSGA